MGYWGCDMGRALGMPPFKPLASRSLASWQQNALPENRLRSFLWSTFRLSTSWRICSLNRLPRLHSLVSCLCSLGTLALITPGTLPDRLLAVGASYGPEASCPSAPAFFRFLLSAVQSLSSTSFGTVGGCSSVPVGLPVVSYI